LTDPSLRPARWLLLFAAASVIWGSSFFFIRIAVEHMPPSVVVFGRTVLGAAFSCRWRSGAGLPRRAPGNHADHRGDAARTLPRPQSWLGFAVPGGRAFARRCLDRHFAKSWTWQPLDRGRAAARKSEQTRSHWQLEALMPGSGV